MKCRECGKSGATDKTWGLCKSCYKIYLKIGPKNLPNIEPYHR